MGLSILAIVLYHTPYEVTGSFLWNYLHGSAYWGVDVFLFLSGLGACHSLASRGGRGYLARRVRRLLPGLYLFMVPWGLLMWFSWGMTRWDLIGTLTLLGWWFGFTRQLNWYFSAVWAFFLLAVPVGALLRRCRRPAPVWAGLLALSLGLGLWCPMDYLMTAATRLPVFFTGMLFGELDRRGYAPGRAFYCLVYLLVPIGLILSVLTFGVLGEQYGDSFGLWWYPNALIVPGLAVAAGEIGARLRAFPWLVRAAGFIPALGESAAEILMVHVGIYKYIRLFRTFTNLQWLLISLICIILGRLYYRFVTSRITARLEQRRA